MNLQGAEWEINANRSGYAYSKISAAMSVRDRLNSKGFAHFFVDEFQSFVNDSFKDIPEARKYVGTDIAHRYIEQVLKEVRNAVFGNVGTLVTFRVGPLDAEMFEVFSTSLRSC